MLPLFELFVSVEAGRPDPLGSEQMTAWRLLGRAVG